MDLSQFAYDAIDRIVSNALHDTRSLLQGIAGQTTTEKSINMSSSRSEASTLVMSSGPPTTVSTSGYSNGDAEKLKSSRRHSECSVIQPVDNGKLAMKSNVTLPDCGILHELQLRGIFDKTTMGGTLELNGKEYDI